MKRIAFVAAAALLGTACGSSSPPPPPTGSLDLGWTFQRYRLTDQSWLTYSCAIAGVNNVVVSSSTGQSFGVPCSDSVGDGATIHGVWTGAQNIVVTGRRDGDALFVSDPVPVTIAQGQLTQVQTPVPAAGIPGNIYVYANFLDQFGAAVPNWVSCGNVQITSLTYEIRDYAESVIASGSVSCADPAGVSFVGTDALDLDNYAIRMKAYRTTNQVTTQIFDSATMALTPTCTRPSFDHLASGDSWDVPLYDITLNGTPPTNYGFCP